MSSHMGSKRPPALDRVDIRILAVLQRDGRSTIQRVAEKVSLSPRACLERVRRLEAGGLIVGYQAIIAVELLSRPLTIFAEIALVQHGRHAQVERRLAAIEEVVECWEISGTFDYLARFACRDLAQYQMLTSRLIDESALGIARIVSHIALRPVRRFLGYPESLFERKS